MNIRRPPHSNGWVSRKFLFCTKECFSFRLVRLATVGTGWRDMRIKNHTPTSVARWGGQVAELDYGRRMLFLIEFQLLLKQKKSDRGLLSAAVVLWVPKPMYGCRFHKHHDNQDEPQRGAHKLQRIANDYNWQDTMLYDRISVHPAWLDSVRSGGSTKSVLRTVRCRRWRLFWQSRHAPNSNGIRLECRRWMRRMQKKFSKVLAQSCDSRVTAAVDKIVFFFCCCHMLCALIRFLSFCAIGFC